MWMIERRWRCWRSGCHHAPGVGRGTTERRREHMPEEKPAPAAKCTSGTEEMETVR
jgi:hypothetical protein